MKTKFSGFIARLAKEAYRGVAMGTMELAELKARVQAKKERVLQLQTEATKIWEAAHAAPASASKEVIRPTRDDYDTAMDRLQRAERELHDLEHKLSLCDF